MKVVIDIGNTNIKMAAYSATTIVGQWRMQTDLRRTEDEYAVMTRAFFASANISVNDIKGVIICSVVPPMLFTIQKLCEALFHVKPLVVGPGVKTGLNIKYENPREVGSDRIVNAVAALDVYKGTPLVIIDFGTATTYCYLNERGDYLGGVITPGITIATEALYTQAARLPRIELKRPRSIVGKTTIEAMQAGVYYGIISQVEGIVSRLAAQGENPPLVIATGGLAPLLAHDMPIIDIVDETLTLKGLVLIYERNQK
ncbi:MAG TPA: type III pantothenate kinase [Metalysinibacillus jejuensis]|uniref:Type III pantothenate kinase n=1 Tax=Metalysinibacillus jejuensis TaxID=914327 RepID=A0A921T496_9BACL|nr:type III pantothenate kinase [Metalysinibacillus jejuensis]HJH10101.1 type III pantothenate kinase [Metalysinibacillus jejuensis]